MDNNNGNIFNPPININNQQNNNPQVAYLNNKDNNINQQNQNDNNEEDDELHMIMPKEDSPNNEEKNNEVSVTPGNNLDSELENYYKELYKKDKQNSQLEKIEKQKKELDLELNTSFSFSFNQYTKPSLVVLENVGNSTYMSCVLQCLANIKSIAKYYLKELDTIKKKLIEMPLSYAFSRTIFHLYPYPQNTLQKSYYLSSFYKMTLLLNPFYQGQSTKNAVDFLVFLLETLHNEDKQLQKYQNNNEKCNNKDFKEYIKYLSKNENSIIFTDFGWVSQKIRKCDMCNSEAINYQQYFTFDLDIDKSLNNANLNSQNKLSIYDCIKCQNEKDKKYNVHCKNCQKKTNFDEENLISVSPNYFIFILRLEEKINMKENNRINIGIKICIDEELNLNNLIKENFNNISPNYTLVGIIVYDFGNKDYKAYCLNAIDKKWYKYEKDKIIKIKKEIEFNLDELMPVILFYKLKTENNN